MAKAVQITDREIKLFEDNLELINKIISLHIHKWKMKAIPSIDKDDISQELRAHIISRLSKYNEDRPLGNWLTTVVTNWIINCLRNCYTKFAKPCVGLKCAAYLGGNDCKLYVKTCSDCPLYAKWEMDKKQQHDVKLTVTIEDHLNEVNFKPFEETDILEKLEELKFKLKEKLTDNEFYIFESLYLNNKTEAEIITELKFSSKAAGAKEIKSLKQTIYERIKKILVEEELF